MSARATGLRVLSLWSVLVFAAFNPTGAVEVSGLYEVRLPADSRAAGERERVFKEALAQVLTRVTGDPGSAQRAAGERIVARASRYVQQYQYREASDGASDYELRVSFDGAGLERALREASLPVWGAQRPAVLVWLAVQSGGQRVLVGEDTERPSRAVLAQAAEARGIPLRFPLLDAEDRSQVDAADVIGGFDEALRAASGRYDADMVLVARARARDAAYWRGRWRLYLGEDQRLAWDSQGNSLEAVLTQGLQALADNLAERLAIAPGARASADAIVTIEGVDGLEDYARVGRYLGTLGPVRTHRLQSIRAGQATFRLALQASSEDLARVIELGGMLERVRPQAPTGEDAGRVEQQGLRFRLAR